MASYARRFIAQGVRLVGGCCGTTPEHIRQIKLAVRALAPETSRAVARKGTDGPHEARGGHLEVASTSGPAVALEDKSELAHALAAGRFVTLVDLLPPKGHVSDEVVERARLLKIRGVDVLGVPDGPKGARMSALSLAVLVQQKAGIETILQYSCRDRNLLGMQSDLLGAHAMGIRNLVIVTGDPQRVGDYPDATGVFDVDSIGLTNVLARLNQGLDVGGQGIGKPTAFHIGVMVNPGAEDLDAEVKRFNYKLEAGAEFAMTKPVFDVGTFERLFRRIESARLPIILSLWPFDSLLNAEFMANEVPGIRVPEDVVGRMRAAADPAAEGIAIAREVGAALKAMVQGLHVSTPAGRLDSALLVLQGV
jgi:homocysteine S-methyltransferase